MVRPDAPYEMSDVAVLLAECPTYLTFLGELGPDVVELSDRLAAGQQGMPTHAWSMAPNRCRRVFAIPRSARR